MDCLRERLPETKQYKNHQAQTSGHSMVGLLRKMVKDNAVKYPIATVAIVLMALSAVLGLCFHSWTVALGVYSLISPLPLYYITRNLENTFLESGLFILLSIWIGLITHSVWAGIITGFAITLIVTLSSHKSDSE